MVGAVLGDKMITIFYRGGKISMPMMNVGFNI